MRFWRNNRLDGEFEMAPERVVEMFEQSPWWSVDTSLDRNLRAFLTDPAGPISAVWDNENDYDDLLRRAREAAQRREA